jgi:hypothetical protein
MSPFAAAGLVVLLGVTIALVCAVGVFFAARTREAQPDMKPADEGFAWPRKRYW